MGCQRIPRVLFFIQPAYIIIFEVSFLQTAYTGSYILLIPWINLFFNWYIQTTYIYCNYLYIRAYESFFVFCLFPLFSILLCPFSCSSMDYVYIFFEFHFHISLVFWDVSLCIVFFCSWSSYYTHTYKHIYVILQSTSASILLLCLCGMQKSYVHLGPFTFLHV